jgi:Flp pilus assembly pilin Flp
VNGYDEQLDLRYRENGMTSCTEYVSEFSRCLYLLNCAKGSKNMLKSFLNDECGAIVSIEMILIITIAVLALIVGWSEIAKAVNTELNDISNAVGSLNQSYFFTGYHSGGVNGQKATASYAGSAYTDFADDCDLNNSCDLVCGNSSPEQP